MADHEHATTLNHGHDHIRTKHAVAGHSTALLDLRGQHWASQQGLRGRCASTWLGLSATTQWPCRSRPARSNPVLRRVLRPEIAALTMSGSSFVVAVNTLMLKRLGLPRPVGSTPAADVTRTAAAGLPR